MNHVLLYTYQGWDFSVQIYVFSHMKSTTHVICVNLRKNGGGGGGLNGLKQLRNTLQNVTFFNTFSVKKMSEMTTKWLSEKFCKKKK